MPDTLDRLPAVDFPLNVFAPDDPGFPLTSMLVELVSSEPSLRGPAPSAIQDLVESVGSAAYDADQPDALEDVHRALYVIYETSLANPLSPACLYEHKPWLVRMRQTLEDRWLAHDVAQLPEVPGPETASMTTDEVNRWLMDAAAAETELDRRVVSYLESEATVDDYRFFVLSDGHLNYRFYDAMVLAALHYLEPVKAEMSHHFWEESGEGDLDQAHTRQFSRTLGSLGLTWDDRPVWDDWRPYAGHNLYFLFGLSRRYYFRAVGSLAMPELFDVGRDSAVVRGLARLGFDPQRDFEYYWNHVEADQEHGPEWLTGVIDPIVRAQPAAIPEVLLGAALRMLGMRRFNEYLAERFGLVAAAV